MKIRNLKTAEFLPAVLIFLCIAVAGPAAVSAQSDADKSSGPEMMVITMIKVKPEMQPNFEKMVKEEYNPAIVKGGAKVSHVWRVAVGNAFEYVFVAPLENMAAMDGPSPLNKGLGAEKMAAFYQKSSTMLNDINSYIVRARPDLSHDPGMTSAPNIAIVIDIETYPMKGKMLEKFIKDEYLPVIRKTDVPALWTNQSVFGGNANMYTLVELQRNFAELDKGPLAGRVLKPEEVEKMFQKMPEGTVKNVNIVIAKFQPELSILGEPPGK